MIALTLAQKIKVLRERNLKIPIIRTCTVPYDEEKPSIFDSSITQETVDANIVIASLLGVIKYLSKELLLQKGVKSKDVWSKLSEVKKLLTESKNTIHHM